MAFKKRKTLLYKGQEYRSLLEIKMLQQIEKLKVHVDYETERFPYSIRRTYVPDFVCKRADGTTFYIEVKGYLRPSDRTKLLAVKETSPTIDLKLVFAQDNKLNSKSKTRYSEWAIKHGFEFSIGHVKKEWFQVKRSRRRLLQKTIAPGIVSIFEKDRKPAVSSKKTDGNDPRRVQE